ncbi:uncharacterized protein LOC129781493 [Toxorhynchites rutilus septentrionalis]|uniref:uncharacterized protein LOC129781493 n=1 Tax=Toxorhynchites rutilus septentrionalis TaxID=329112 RepID=UPI00247A60A6|nr:uncharacterized protein LOC129781493 [Toxorhynchites rutilus septentrionalis]
MPETDRFDCQMCDLANNADDMVQCEGCGKWSHFGCAGFDEGRKDEHWMCHKCVVESANSVVGVDSNVSVGLEPAHGQTNANGSDEGAKPIGELAQLNLKLLEERKAFLLREIELQQTIQLEQRKLQLEKEMWKARYDIINARCGATNRDVMAGSLGDWLHRLDQVAVSQNELTSAPARTVTVSATSSRTRPQHSAAGNTKNIPQTTPSSPAVTSLFGGKSVLPSWIISPTMSMQSNSQLSQPTTSGYASGQGSLSHDFQPGRGANGPGASTPVSTINWVNPVTGFTSSTQCLPPYISSVGQIGSHPMQPWHVSQPYQVPNSLHNFAPVGQVASSQYAYGSVGTLNPVASSINAYPSYIPYSFPSMLPQHNPYLPQIPLGGQMGPLGG